MQLGFFTVISLEGADAQSASTMAKVSSKMNEDIRGTLFLPPYMRPNQCNIAQGSVLFGCLDEVTGRGFAMYGQEDADFQYFFDADIAIRKTLNVTGKATLEDKLAVTKAVTMSDALTVSGEVNAKDFGAMMTPAEPEGATPISVKYTKHVHTSAAPGSPTTPPVPTPS